MGNKGLFAGAKSAFKSMAPERVLGIPLVVCLVCWPRSKSRTSGRVLFVKIGTPNHQKKQQPLREELTEEERYRVPLMSCIA
jgi:hypothetical protein